RERPPELNPSDEKRGNKIQEPGAFLPSGRPKGQRCCRSARQALRSRLRREGSHMALALSLAVCDYDRTRAIFDGRAMVEGCDITAVPLEPEETFHRAFKF